MLENLNCTQSSRAEQLQFLRFAAFLNVFLLHVGELIHVPFSTWNSAISSVSFFFILSGAATGFSGYAKMCELSWRAVADDICRKLKKMYPLYFLVTFFSVFYSDLPTLLANHAFADAFTPLKLFVKHLLLLQSWFPAGYFGFSGVGWFLSTLLSLCLLNRPLMVFLKKTEKCRHYFLLYGFLIAFFLLLTTVYCYLTRNTDMPFTQYVFPPARAGEYLSGMVLGFGLHRWQSQCKPRTKTVLPFTVLEIAVLVFWGVAVLAAPDSDSWCNYTVCWVVPNLFVIGVYLCGFGQISRLFRWKPLVKLGDITFTCFLIHQVVIILYISLSHAAFLSRLGDLLAVLLCLSFTVLSALYLSKT